MMCGVEIRLLGAMGMRVLRVEGKVGGGQCCKHGAKGTYLGWKVRWVGPIM